MAKRKNKTRADRFFEELLSECRRQDPRPRKPITAGELLKQLESDPEWVRQRNEREAEREQRHREYLRIEKPVVDDLHEAGCEVESVWDLVNSTPDTYGLAVPVLVYHLGQESHPDKVRESCARALSKKAARPYFDAIFDIFQTMPNTGANRAKWATANALGVAVTRNRLEKAIEILFDPKHDIACKHVLYYNIKRFKIPGEKRAAIEAMFLDIDWEKDEF